MPVPAAPIVAFRGSDAGSPGPDFSLPASTGGTVRLSALRGRPVVLVFYALDGTPVCTDQLTLYNEILDTFTAFDAVLLAISVDTIASHEAFAAARGLEFPLLSDAAPRGAVARAYDVWREAEGISERALFVLDAAGVIRWREVAALRVNPGADGILRALEALGAEPGR